MARTLPRPRRRFGLGALLLLAAAGCTSRQQAEGPTTDTAIAAPQDESQAPDKEVDSKQIDLDEVNRAIARPQSTRDRFTSLGDEAEIAAMILGEMGPPARDALPALARFVETDKHPDAVAAAKDAIAKIKGRTPPARTQR
jgi:hypothetical protein